MNSKTAFTDPQTGQAPGLAFESLVVSNLETSINYYEALGFTAVGDKIPAWTTDEAANKLYKTPGAMSRTAVLQVPSTGSGKMFTLYLKEFKNVARGKRADFPARNPSASHFGLMVPEADELWAQLKERKLLRALSWDAQLTRLPGQKSGGIAYVMDPDGYNIEIVGINLKPGGASAPKSSLHHLGLAVLDSGKAMKFYGNLLGAKFPDVLPEWLSGDMYDAAVGGRGFVIRLINGAFPEAAAPETTMNFELVEYQKPTRPDVDDYAYSDVSVNCVGIKVDRLDSMYTKLVASGVKSWAGAGIVQKNDGTRAVLVRDPDVGAFVELFEKN